MKYADLPDEIKMQCKQIAANKNISLCNAVILLKSYFITDKDFEKYCNYSK